MTGIRKENIIPKTSYSYKTIISVALLKTPVNKQTNIIPYQTN